MSVRTRVAKRYRKEYLRATGDYSICTERMYKNSSIFNDLEYWRRRVNELYDNVKYNLSKKNCNHVCIWKELVNRHYEYKVYYTYKDKFNTGSGKSLQEAYNDATRKILHYDTERNSSGGFF